MRSEKTRAWTLAIVSTIVLASITAASVLMKPEKRDAQGCSEDVSGKTVILLDQTQAIPKQTADEILARVGNLIESKVREGELVSVFSVTELSKKNLVPIFAYCKPPKTARGFNQSQRYVSKNFDKHFAKPLQAVLSTPITGSTQSPIAQAVIDLSLSDYLHHPAARLVVISDFMEYTERFKTYNCRNPRDAIARFRTARGAAVARPVFQNVEIHAHVIPRSEVSQEVMACNNVFWNWFFGDNQGENAAFVPNFLPG